MTIRDDPPFAFSAREPLSNKKTSRSVFWPGFLLGIRNQIPERREAEANHLVLEHVFLSMFAFLSLVVLFQQRVLLSTVAHGFAPFIAYSLTARFLSSRVSIRPSF